MKKISTLSVIMCSFLFLAACGHRETVQSGVEYKIHEVNKEETKVVPRSIFTEETKTEQLVDLLVNELSRAPENTENRAAIPKPLTLLGYIVSDENVTLDFDSSYSNLSQTGEILTRAAIVRTLTQIEDINYVSILVDGKTLLNSLGNPVGIMTAEQFIDNSGNEINTEEVASLTLYFANKEGDGLVKINREVAYSSNISLEKLVVEQLIAGVEEDEDENGTEEEAYPTINPNTKIVSVNVWDGVCYVSLSNEFLTQVYSTRAEVTIYSIVNSLVELSDINKVQILIDGEDELMYREKISLSNTYGRNLELVEGGE